MKKILLLPVGLLLGLVLFSGNTIASHEITYFLDNKKGALSLTFDDGYLSQFTSAVPLLSARNLKGTFFLITNWIPGTGGVTWDQWRQVAEQGHEIGSHTVTHPDLIELSDSELRRELSESQKAIEMHIPSQFCVSFAYPY
jgi:oligosaccharide reducing-end xylanase